MVSAQGFRERLATLLPHLNERQRRLAAAVEARALCYGGVSTVAEATGLARWRAGSCCRRSTKVLTREGYAISSGTVGRLLTSMGYRVRLWKLELQTLADKTGLHVTVCHLPPGDE